MRSQPIWGDAPLSLSPYALRNNDGTVDVQSPYPSIIIRKEIANDIRILQLLPFWVTTECYRWSDPRSVEPAGPLLGFRRIPSDRRRTAPPYPGWWIAGSHPLPPGFACLIGVPRLGAVRALFDETQFFFVRILLIWSTKWSLFTIFFT